MSCPYTSLTANTSSTTNTNTNTSISNHTNPKPQAKSYKAPLWCQQLPQGQTRRYRNREMISVPGQSTEPGSAPGTDNRVFLIRSGRARICLFGAGKEQTLGYLQPGSIYVSHTPAWVEAVESVELTHWPLHQLQQLFQAQPELAITALREVGQLMTQAIQLIEDFAFRSVEERLARFLLTEARAGNSHDVILPGSTEALANLLGTSRQTLSSLLNRMEKSGLIERPERQHLRLKSIEAIRTLAQGVSAS